MWDRSLDKARALERFGARVAGSLAEVVAGAERAHIVLSDDATVDAVLEQAAPAIGKGALVLDHTTVSPAGNRGDRRRLAVAVAQGVVPEDALELFMRRSADGAPEVGRWVAGGRPMGSRSLPMGCRRSSDLRMGMGRLPPLRRPTPRGPR